MPLVRREAPIIGTGIEYRAAKDSGAVVVARNSGIAERVTADEIIIKEKMETEIDIIYLSLNVQTQVLV